MIRYEIVHSVGRVLLDNPPVNGITEELLDALMTQLRQCNSDPAVRAIVIASAIPGRFSAGLDLATFRQSTPAQVNAVVRKLYFDLFDLQSTLAKPVIGAVSGAVRGGGMSIAITCDMLVAAETATFGYPELDVGLVPAIHFNHLPRLVGRYQAFDLLFTGRVFSAQEAMQFGLISRIAPEGEVMETAHEIGRTFAQKSPELVRLGKRAFAWAATPGYREGASAAVDLVSTVFSTQDGQEGLAAFVEKRRPRWGG